MADSLFDAPFDDEWQEVPQERFLSWTAAEQFAYCARRDESSALIADTSIEARWYLARADAYKELSRVQA